MVSIRPRAEEDLYQIWYYIAVKNKSPLNAKRFISRLNGVFNKLSSNPKIGVAKFEYSNNLHQYNVGQYLVFYFPVENGVEIARVLHGARNILDLL